MGFTIGPIAIAEPVCLAPMTGVTDLPFRRLVKRYGAGLVFSEMIASRAMIDANRSSTKASLDYSEEFPMAAQLAGCEPDIVAEAARMNVDRGAAIIDLNFGCPVKKIVTKMGGSALMRDEKLAAAIMEATVKAVAVPVTVKMRLGWDHENLNAASLSRIAEDIGIRMITVHGRTRSQMYNGSADWKAVRAIKENVPAHSVLVNGDITTVEAAKLALQESGADGVMIGRGANGRPWFPRQVIDYLATGAATEDPPLSEIAAVLQEHYDAILDYYGFHQGIGIARKHIGWYCQTLPGNYDFRAAVNRLTEPAAVKSEIAIYFDRLQQAA